MLDRGTASKVVIGASALVLAFFFVRSSSSLSGLDGKEEIHKRYVAKKFWGTTVLTGEAWDSMRKTAARSADPKIRSKAMELSNRLSAISREALQVAEEYDPKWIAWKQRSNDAERVREEA